MLVIASRGSQLALWQAHWVEGQLAQAGLASEIEIIKTTGDKITDVALAQVGTKGMFTKEIEEALAESRIDLAVHSLKDLPTALPEPFALAATPPRADARDVFVSIHHANLAALPWGARVGTSSERRRAQLKALRVDLEPVEFRGNVDTRLRKLAEGQVEAILLAAAGLDRLGKTDWVRERLDPREFCPAAGQGALAIETRKGDQATIDAVAFLDDADTRFAVTAERAALEALGGGCQVPIGIHCRPSFDDMRGSVEWEVFAVVAAPHNGTAVRVHHRAKQSEMDAGALGRLVAKKLIEAGAAPLLSESSEAQR